MPPKRPGATARSKRSKMRSMCSGAMPMPSSRTLTQAALELVRSGRVDLEPMVTHRFGLDDVAEAFETAASKAGGAIMVVVTP